MSATGLDVFDRILQTTNKWLDDIMEMLGPDRQVAWHALGAVLRAIRDRLPLGLAIHLGAQLPLLVRGLYYDQWHAHEQPLKFRSVDEFLDHVAKELGGVQKVDVQDAARAVLQVLAYHIEPGQLRHVYEALPEQVRAFWVGSGEARLGT